MRQLIGWVLSAVRAAGWAPIAVFAAHVIASRVLGTHLAFPSLDIPMHLAGGAAITYFFWRSLHVQESRFVVGEMVSASAGLLSFTAVATAAVVWEFAEWISDRYMSTHAQLGLEDTLLDMLLGIVGGLIVVLVAVMRAAGQNRGVA